MASDASSWRILVDDIRRAKWLRTAVIALGISNLALFWMAAPLISPHHLTVYHWSGSAYALFAQVWLNLIFIWIVAAGSLNLARLGKRWRRAVWLAILVGMPAMVFISFKLGGSDGELVPGVESQNHIHLLFIWLYGLCPLLWVALLLCWRPKFDSYFERAVQFAEVMLTFCGIAGVAMLAQLAWSNWRAADLNRAPALHVRSGVATAKPRMVWLVMDELSYQQLYEQRFPGLALPEFDRLAAQSAVFTNVIPAGLYTDHILPALITGRPVEDMRSSAEGQLLTRVHASDKLQAFDEYDTVFQDALKDGYSTGLVGWWNPYCRLMPAVLDHCYWTAWFAGHKDLAEGESLSAKLRGTVQRAFIALGMILPNRLNERLQAFGPDDRLHVAQTYLDLSEHADELLNDSTANFVMIHIPIPHPVGIYSRATGQLSATPTSYIDNLALCDIYLTHLRKELEARGEWDSTTLVVMGDHGWRTQIWKHRSWYETDEAASHGGKFDTRPGYIVKLPNQHTGARINDPFHALETRSLLDALMSKQIVSERDLEAWVRAHP